MLIVFLLSLTLGSFDMAACFAQAIDSDYNLLIEGAKTEISNLHLVTEGIWRGGQPTNIGLVKLKAAGVKTIINLRNEEVLVEQEKANARQIGLRFYNIPLDVFNQPQTSEIRQFLAIAEDKENQPIFVHCLHGQDRTGSMIATYRIAKQGWSATKAYQEMLSYGFHPQYVNLTRAVFDYAAALGHKEMMPSTASIVDDLKERFTRLISR